MTGLPAQRTSSSPEFDSLDVINVRVRPGVFLFANSASTDEITANWHLDATFEQLRASGAEVLQEPTDMDYGARDCAFRDPSGNMLRISQR